MARPRKLLLTATASLVLLGVLGAAAVYLTLRLRAVEYAAPQQAPAVQPQDLKVFRTKRIYFGHQSVGENILDGLGTLYRANGAPAPTIQEVTAAANVKGGERNLLHSLIGENGDPDSKLAAFASMMRSGMAERVDVALMKLCYVDIKRTTDPRTVFEHYRTTMGALEREFPRVTFVYTTIPLRTADAYRNNLRTQFNSLVRTELKDKVVLDIAEVESRAVDGSRATDSTFGFPYEQLQSNYASDGAHLNTEGAKRVAASLVATVAGAHRSG